MQTTSNESAFAVLNAINCNEHTEQKNGLTYLSWAWAWQMVKKHFPDATYTVYERPDGCPYWTDGRTAWVKTGVTIQGQEHIEYLPIMDLRNNSIPVEKITSFDMNKAIQRSLTKAAARHGLGLYIYAGEDLPEEEAAAKKAAKPSKTAQKPVSSPAPKENTSKMLPGGETYLKIVAAHALGKRAKDGTDYRTAWATATNAGEEMLAAFDHDVAAYKMNNHITQ